MEETKNSLAARYNSFQQPAVQAVVEDFKTNLSGKYLLVIPIGGVKTVTAIKIDRSTV